MHLLAEDLTRRGIHVEMWTTTPGGTVPAGVKVHRPCRALPMPLYLVWLATTIAKARYRRRRDRVVVVVARVSAESLILTVSARFLRLPVVVFLTGGDIHGSEFVAQRRAWVRRALLTGASAFVSHATVLLDEVREAGFRGPCVRVPTIAPAAEHGAECGWVPAFPTPLVWCGRDDPVKNVAFLLRLVDEGYVERGALLLLTDAALASGGVQVHLYCPNPRTHLRQASVLLLPSLIEGQSNVLAEAAMEGTPTVAFATGGTPEIVADLDGGEVVTPDDVDAFVAAIATVSARFSTEDGRARLRHRAKAVFAEGAPQGWADVISAVAR